MAQQQQAPKQTQDPYAQRGKLLASTVQRLRGWVGSDPSRTPELADALVQLTEHRLKGHGYAAAAADAQESVRLAAQLWSASPLGPYASTVDASRVITTLVHVATVQSGLGRPDSAGQTLQSAQDLRRQLGEVGLQEQLTPTTKVWELLAEARVALAAGDVPRANEAADRLADPAVRDDADEGFLAIDVEWLLSDCRWAAGRAPDALAHLHAAKDRYDELVGLRLTEPARLSPALVERLAEPAFALHRDLADRLLGTGELDLALAVRRSCVELLDGLVGRLGEPARVQLALTLTDLANDLLATDRAEEAVAAAEQAEALGRKLPSPARLLVASAYGQALTRVGRSGEALALLRPIVLPEDGAAASAAGALGLSAWAAALRADGDTDAADATERKVTDLVSELTGSAEARPARPTLQDLARGVLTRGPESARSALDLAEQKQRETAAWLEAERAEAHRLEMARMEQAQLEAERREAEQQAAERAAAERAETERAELARAEREEAERRTAAEEAEAAARKRRREERLEEHRLEAERLEAERQEAERLEVERLAAVRLAAEPDELVLTQQEWVDAKDRGDRRRARAANERLVELLRPHAQANPTEFGPQLRQALEELSSARLRSGDLFGSRALSREAKALARTLGG